MPRICWESRCYLTPVGLKRCCSAPRVPACLQEAIPPLGTGGFALRRRPGGEQVRMLQVLGLFARLRVRFATPALCPREVLAAVRWGCRPSSERGVLPKGLSHLSSSFGTPQREEDGPVPPHRGRGSVWGRSFVRGKCSAPSATPWSLPVSPLSPRSPRRVAGEDLRAKHKWSLFQSINLCWQPGLQCMCFSLTAAPAPFLAPCASIFLFFFEDLIQKCFS